MRILVVDDDKQVVFLLKAVVDVYSEKETNTVDTACSAEKALALFEPGKYDLIITDLRLQSMNGLEFCLKVREQDSDVIIVALTGFYDPIFTSYDGTLAGFNAVFEKGAGFKPFMKYLKEKLNM